MANADIRITLREGEPMGALLRYDPGGVIQGAVQLTPDGAFNCRGVYLRLQWRTEGRGDRDQEKIAERVLAEGPLAANVSIRHDFNFGLPREPWSYAGHYVSIIWEIAVVVDIPLATDINAQQPFILAPRRAR
jgi:hypothetical protein